MIAVITGVTAAEAIRLKVARYNYTLISRYVDSYLPSYFRGCIDVFSSSRIFLQMAALRTLLALFTLLKQRSSTAFSYPSGAIFVLWWRKMESSFVPWWHCTNRIPKRLLGHRQ